MGVFQTTLKTHKRTNITTDFIFIHDCAIHKCKPEVWHIVAGKRKEDHWVVVCKEDEDCNKISMHSDQQVVDVWNNYNPTK